MSAIPLLPQSSPRVATRAQSRANAKAFAQFLTFGFVSLLTFGASSMVGQVMLEQARQERLSAIKTSTEVRAEVADLSRQVNDMSNYLVVSDWASTHGMVSPVLDVEPKNETRVASR